MRGIFDDMTYDDSLSADAGTDYGYIDNYETGVSQTAQATTDYTQSADFGEFQMYAAQSEAGAKAEVVSAAASGRPVSAAAAETLRASGIDLNNIVINAAGAAFKLAQNAQGHYVAQPLNAQAQTAAQSTAARNKLFLIGGGLLALFAFLH